MAYLKKGLAELSYIQRPLEYEIKNNELRRYDELRACI